MGDRVLSLVLALACGMLLAGCAPSPVAAPQTPAAPGEAAPLRVIKPQRATIHREVSQPGAIEAFEETPIFAKISGYVKKWHADIGDVVSEGQLLAELSVPELQVEREQKEALIRQAEEQIEQARKAAAAAEAALHSATSQIKEAEASQERAVAERKRTRSQYERLVRAGQTVIDKESIEETRLAHETAEAGFRQAEARVQSARALREESKAKWDRAQADVRVAEANREVAVTNRDYVKAQLDYTRLTAPYAGVVTARTINTGDFVQAATAGKGRPLYVVERTNLMRIFVQVPETDAVWVHKGASARLRVPVLRGQEFTGSVTRISWSLDQTTRTLRAEIDLPNTGDRLRPGMYAHATLAADLADVLTLPRSAVATEGEITRGYQSYCYQVVDGKARRLSVELGTGDSERVEVLRKQTQKGGPWELFTGSEAILDGRLADVREGQEVAPSGRE